MVESITASTGNPKRRNTLLVGSHAVPNIGLLSLRSLTVPRFALRRSEAAASLGISESLFETWIDERKMPVGRKIGGVVLWDVRALSAAWDNLVSEGEIVSDLNPFSGVVG